ncbi:NuA4-domain-containing protein [Hypoxylon sp. FL1284]|nr:NuA4-domain-containing protein [Hypoxylon sp. FL1284]
MAENAQSSTGRGANGDQQAAIAEYTKQRQTLKALLAKRKQHENQLYQLEHNILEIENRYLYNTRHGNIVKGFDNYIKGTSAAAQRKQGELKDEDYIWSRSSISYNSFHPDNEPLSTTSTPGAPTPVSTTFANGRDKDSGSNQATPTSATADKALGKAGKAGKKRPQPKKEKDGDVDDSETDSRETKKVRMHFGASRK